MRYINLKKRNISKFQFLTRRVAIVSAFTLSIFAIIAFPISRRITRVEASNNNQIQNIGEEYVEEGIVDVEESIDLGQVNN